MTDTAVWNGLVIAKMSPPLPNNYMAIIFLFYELALIVAALWFGYRLGRKCK